MLEWEKLLNPARRKDLDGSSESLETGVGREELERDFDRILFLSPTRRLADKTQVFPLEQNDSVRTRLTHSYEVSNLARSIGVRLAFDYEEDVFGKKHEALSVKRNIPALLAAIGLVHDLGNPPFGHQGEEAIRGWFKDKCDKSEFGSACHKDHLEFDGNAQTFRLLTRLQILNDEFGLNLTCATLAALIKYPSFWDSENSGGYDKFGIFESERKIVEEVWQETGLTQGVRHPLTYIMEACDDIAYSVLDAEDIVKKGYASFYDLINYLTHNSKNGLIAPETDPVIISVTRKSNLKNEEFKKENLSSAELNDMSMQMFRVKAIFEMVDAAVKLFAEKSSSIMDGSIEPGFKLIDSSNAGKLCKKLKDFDFRYGFKHPEVLKLELEGNNYIKSTMDMLWEAINYHGSSPFADYAYQRISENYRRVYESSKQSFYDKSQLLCDAISGMTDSYLISLHNELRPLSNGFNR